MKDYQERYEQERQEQITNWGKMVTDIFGEIPKESVEITNKEDIIRILNSIGDSKALNHTFIPSGGGLDLTSANYSNEPGKLELDFEGVHHIVNPKSLTFNPIGEDPDWWFFRINTSPFEQSDVYKEYGQEEEEAEQLFDTSSQNNEEDEFKFYGEEVLDIGNGNYIDRGFWDMDYLGYDEDGNTIPLPKNARVVTRLFNGGDYVTFSKYSIYNRVSSTYDGRHAKVDDDTFKRYISGIVEGLKNKK